MKDQQEKTLRELMILIPELVEKKFRRGDAEHGGNLSDMPISAELQELTEELIDALIFVLDISKKVHFFKEKYDRSTMEGAGLPGLDISNIPASKIQSLGDIPSK